jgi:hypothetical protein
MSGNFISIPSSEWDKLIVAIKGDGFLDNLSGDAGIGLLGVLIGILAGAGIDYIKELCRRRRHKAALRAEIKFARKAATAFIKSLRDSINHSPPKKIIDLVPTAKLATAAYNHSFPMLLASGTFDENGISSILEYYNVIETYNHVASLVLNSSYSNYAVPSWPTDKPLPVCDLALLKECAESIKKSNLTVEDRFVLNLLLKISHLRGCDRSEDSKYWSEISKTLGIIQ